MAGCPICGAEGGVETSFIVVKKNDQNKDPIGIGKCNICFGCIRKKRLPSDIALIITGAVLLAAVMIFLVLMKFFGPGSNLSDAFTILGMFFAPCFLLCLIGIYGIRKTNRECRNKTISERSEKAAAKCTVSHFKRAQQVPAECMLLNFEKLYNNGQFGNLVMEWRDADTDATRLNAVSTFLSKCTQEPIEAGEYSLEIIPTASVGVLFATAADTTTFLRYIFKFLAAKGLMENVEERIY